uniref:N-acetylglucosaminylphosphatidylinositol deacetylase n=1 Tax=Cyprinus carpio TaxID=7962 RepID=A0A8C2BW58_CYPCA
SQVWPHLRNKISTPLNTVGNASFCPTRERSSALLRNSEEDEPRVTAGETRALLVTAHPDHRRWNRGGWGGGRPPSYPPPLGVSQLFFYLVNSMLTRELPDDPAVQWSTALISSLTLKHIRNYSISVVLTFDGSGVSGHANHIAIYVALRHLASAGRLPEGCQILSLHSISLLRKYVSVLELPVSWLLPSDFCCIIGWEEYKHAKKAMFCHHSQLLWFRRLYILFSRYMLVNTFQAITVETKNVKIY